MAPKNYLVAVGFKGAIDSELGVNTLEAYVQRDLRLRGQGRRGAIAPLIESNPGFEPRIIPIQDRTHQSGITDAVQREYSRLCDPLQTNPEMFFPGPFGDFMQFFRNENSYLMIASHLAFPKPGLAMDVGIVAKCINTYGENNYYLVTGVRKNEPGKGKPSFVGGYRNIGTGNEGVKVFDSGIYTLLHESLEEMGITIHHKGPEELRTDYSADKVPVEVSFAESKIKVKAIVHYISTIPTSNLSCEQGGEALPDNSKRVYATDNYLLPLDLGAFGAITPEKLKSLFNPGDDVTSVEIFDITSFVLSGSTIGLRQKVQLGIHHHNTASENLIRKLHQLHVAGTF